MQLSIRKVVSLAGLSAAAVALAVFLMGWSNGVTQVHAAPDTSVDFSISTLGCDSTGGPLACNAAVGSTSSLAVNLLALPSNGNYDGFDTQLVFTGGLAYSCTVGTCANQPGGAGSPSLTGAGQWPDCANPASSQNVVATDISFGCTIGIGAPSSTYVGALMHVDFTCPGAPTVGTITMVAASTDTVDSGFGVHNEDPAADEVLTINCIPATDTPTPVPPTPTPTPPPNPRMQKDCDGATPDVQTLCNVFLQRQGTKIPPARCEDGTDAATLNEGINIPITSQDPKNPSVFQALAAFEFEVRFDPSLVCVSIAAGDLFNVPSAICSALINEGLIRFGCVTAGKGAGIDGPGTLAVITVKPQEELYSILRPNQDNGIPVQILNQSCELADEQGHPISIFSCEDADITFRFLEGDVDGPDCDVDVLDAQQVAFRWGATQGSLLYRSFFDLEPSGQVKGDGDIDIKDLQFVFGRLGSDCDPANQWPPQPPINPKA